jgi:hypothetical protein
METLLQDLRYGPDVLAKNPGFAFLRALPLALVVAANTAIFSIAKAVLFRPLPCLPPERLVFLSEWCRQVPGMSLLTAEWNEGARRTRSSRAWWALVFRLEAFCFLPRLTRRP